MKHKHVEMSDYGWRAVVYDDETEREGHWYGTRAECEAVPISEVKLYPIRDAGPDPFDLACERRHD